MKQAIKKLLVSALDPIIIRLGYKKYVQRGLLNNFWQSLAKMNFTPKHIVDVGANNGAWTRETLTFFPDANYSLFEPQHWLADAIADITSTNPKVKFHGVGVGSQVGFLKFTVSVDDVCSTFRLTEQQAKDEGAKQIDAQIVTLNDFFAGSTLPVPDIIKIDAEGLDLEVLAGASDFFGKTEIFLVEAGVVAKDLDNSFLKVITFMDKQGYRLFEITELNRIHEYKVLWLVELVFVKKGGIIDSQKFS